MADSADGSIRPTEDSAHLSTLNKLQDAGVNLMAVRHGQSEANALGSRLNTHITCGQADSPLTDKGRDQATEAANSVYESLGGDAWMEQALQDPSLLPVIYTSPLGRAHETALATSNHLTHRAFVVAQKAGLEAPKEGTFNPQVDDRLKEIDFGELDLVNVKDMAQSYPELVGNWNAKGKGVDVLTQFPGGESRADVMTRVGSFLDDVAEKDAGKTVVTFSHKETISAQLSLTDQGGITHDGKHKVYSEDIDNAAPLNLVGDFARHQAFRTQSVTNVSPQSLMGDAGRGVGCELGFLITG